MEDSKYQTLLKYLQDSDSLPEDYTGSKRSNFLRDVKLYKTESEKLFRKEIEQTFTPILLPAHVGVVPLQWKEGVHYNKESTNRIVWKEVIPVSKTKELMQMLHKQTGCGARKAMRQATRKYYIPGKEALILVYKQCETCEAMRIRRKEPSFTAIHSDHVAQRLVMDLTFLLNTVIFTIIDHFSKMGWAFIIPSKDMGHVVHCLKQVVLEIGFPPNILQADNGGEFCSAAVNKLIETWGTTQYVHGRPMHPQSQGVVERFNQTLKNQIEILLTRYNHTRVTQHVVAEAVALYRSTHHSTLQDTPQHVWDTCHILHPATDCSQTSTMALASATVLNEAVKIAQRKRSAVDLRLRAGSIPEYLKIVEGDVIWHVGSRKIGLKRHRGAQARNREFTGVVVVRARNAMCQIRWGTTGGPRGEAVNEIGSKWYSVNEISKSKLPAPENVTENVAEDLTNSEPVMEAMVEQHEEVQNTTVEAALEPSGVVSDTIIRSRLWRVGKKNKRCRTQVVAKTSENLC